MGKIKGKKLLILGANPETVPLVERANALGVHTIVTDYTPGAYAKQFAAESYDVDGMDVDALVRLGGRLKIDGVLVGVADRLIVSYQQVCERLGLPCYGTKEQCAVLTDKERFAQICAGQGLAAIPKYPLTKDLLPEDVARLRYPVLVKPTDGNSGKGMSICYRAEDLPLAIDRALENSQSKRFLAERYMTCDDIYIFYTFINGVCWPSVIADRFTYRSQKSGSPVCLGAVSPSRYADLYYEKLHKKMCGLFHMLGMRNGVLMVSAFVEDNEFYLYDPGFRLQGEAPNLTVNKMTGFDHLEMLIRYALLGDNPYAEMPVMADCRKWEQRAATIWYLLRPGKIAKIAGLESVRQDPSVFAVVSRLNAGDTVTEDMVGTERQVFARVYLACRDLNELRQKIDDLQRRITVTDAAGDQMLLPEFLSAKMPAR